MSKHSIKIVPDQKKISDKDKKVTVTSTPSAAPEVRVTSASQLTRELSSIDALIKNHEEEIDNLRNIQTEKQQLLSDLKSKGLKI